MEQSVFFNFIMAFKIVGRKCEETKTNILLGMRNKVHVLFFVFLKIILTSIKYFKFELESKKVLLAFLARNKCVLWKINQGIGNSCPKPEELASSGSIELKKNY